MPVPQPVARAADRDGWPSHHILSSWESQRLRTAVRCDAADRVTSGRGCDDQQL